MTDRYTLKYTNHFSHRINPFKRKEQELIVVGDCKITNYNPQKENGYKEGYITIELIGDNQIIKEGCGTNLSSNQSEADFSSKKFSIFTKIANLDGNSELSVNDIQKMDKSFIEAWGLKDLRFDYKNGVATLIWGDNDILRIDFSDQAVKLSPTTNKNKRVGKQSSDTTQPSGMNLGDNPKIASVVSKFTGGNIDINNVKDLASVARYTGISENYIKEILIGLEGKKKWPLCKAEYDNVPASGHPNGYLTIGFGHTSLAGEPEVTEGLKISVKQAYQILANDIVNAKKLAQNKLKNRGLDFDTLPKSVQNAIIDIVFNKGPSEINNSLVENLKKGYYGAAARRTWFDTPNVGLQKRNMYRFIEAIDSLNKEIKIAAIKRFKSEHLNHLKNVFKKDGNAKVAWNTMCLDVAYKDGCF